MKGMFRIIREGGGEKGGPGRPIILGGSSALGLKEGITPKLIR